MRGSWETQGRTFRTAPPLAPWDRLLPGDWSRFLKGCRSPRRKHQTVTDIQNHLPGSPPGDDRNDDFAQAKMFCADANLLVTAGSVLRMVSPVPTATQPNKRQMRLAELQRCTPTRLA
ncbi:hypothetical protein I79_018028 [Cricetulus griseus]|uniref:Uncharacterized protein n=1 Tax=Cricetulus griseus TaxID=10029 RepID=G3I3L8_CRIGR|nr:hypothetical protein I79_018028 [Cricetulus griseus]ERE86738.1 hypothetical protein H671_1g4300 [Cricetulus griseus]